MVDAAPPPTPTTQASHTPSSTTTTALSRAPTPPPRATPALPRATRALPRATVLPRRGPGSGGAEGVLELDAGAGAQDRVGVDLRGEPHEHRDDGEREAEGEERLPGLGAAERDAYGHEERRA